MVALLRRPGRNEGSQRTQADFLARWLKPGAASPIDAPFLSGPAFAYRA